MVLSKLNKFLQKNFTPNKPMDSSCEMMGEKILRGFLVPEYGVRYYAVEVSEDGENSAQITYQPLND